MLKTTALKPVLVMFVGVPGSGKTTFATQLADTIGAVLLNSDSIRFSMWGSLESIMATHSNEFERKLNNQLTFGALDYAANQTMNAGHSVIYDCNANHIEERVKMAKIAEANKGIGIIVRLKTSLDVATTRLETRTAAPGQSPHTANTAAKLITRFSAEIEEPLDGENMIEITGETSFSEQYEQFSNGLRECLKN